MLPFMCQVKKLCEFKIVKGKVCIYNIIIFAYEMRIAETEDFYYNFFDVEKKFVPQFHSFLLFC